MAPEFEDQQFIVTGAASGIGEATGRKLRRLGARVVAFDRNEPKADAADDFIQFDQGDPSSIAKAVANAPAKIDGLLNIAGAPPGADMSAARLLSINLYGLRALTDQLLSRLATNAAIINMSSHAGHRWRENANMAREFLTVQNPNQLNTLLQRHNIIIDGLDDNCAYPLSKQMLNLWTVQSFPDMEKHNARMNAVSAAGVDTPILDKFLTSFGEASAARMKSIGVVSADAVAAVIIFLASANASAIKSAIIPVDGGASALGMMKQIEKQAGG